MKVNFHIKDLLLRLFTIGNLRPYFFILGFQKCGTTSLYNYLMELDEFIPGLAKEIDTFSEKKFSIGRFHQNFPAKKNNKKTGLASHLFTYVPWSIPRLKEHYPNAKFLIIMRNPIDRAYSHYQHYQRTGGDPDKTFEYHIKKEFEIINGIKNFEDVYEIYDKTVSFSNYGMFITKGLYYFYLKHIRQHGLDFYPVFLEDLEENFETEFEKIMRYLEVSPENLPKNIKHNAGGTYNVIQSETRQKLSDFYAPYNELLFKFLGMESKW